ncbi:MAG: DinB family protein [Algicola sp.]|nr:DinB family protein [Algicola sp.]
MKRTNLIGLLFASSLVFSQESESKELPYYELPEYAETYTAGTMAARMIDALGFRFYWASDGLTETDLNFKPSEASRTTAETIDHILDLSYVILNSTLKQANSKREPVEMSYNAKREEVLNNLKRAADILRTRTDISDFKIIFGNNEFPFWNQVNGPIADAIWHCGQIASYRRSSGNPINPKVNHFSGTVKQ